MKRRLARLLIAGLCLAVVAALAGCTQFGIVVENAPPVANIAAEPTNGHTPLAVALSAEDSTDADGTIVAWQWDFGDTQTDAGELAVHVFETQTWCSTVYTAVLRVVDDDGASDTAAVNVTVRP